MTRERQDAVGYVIHVLERELHENERILKAKQTSCLEVFAERVEVLKETIKNLQTQE